MKALALFAGCLLAASSTFAQNHWVASVTATAHDQSIQSFAYAEYVDDYGNDGWGYITGRHCLDYAPYGGSPNPSYCESFSVFHRAYSGSFDVSAGIGCHDVDLYALYQPLVGNEIGETQHASACLAPPTTCHLGAYIETDGATTTAPESGDYQCGTSKSLTAVASPGFVFNGWTGDVTSSANSITVTLNVSKTVIAHFASITGGGGGPAGGPDPGGGGPGYNEDLPCFPGIDAWCSPIVINFDNGDYQLSGSNAPVLFDIRGDGHPLLMGWTDAHANEAFLWLDRDHNGRVTSGAELFGNFTPLSDGHLAKNGFIALAEFDTDHDGVINDEDPVWPRLQLWRDSNHDGISQPSEIAPLSSSGVTSIDLGYHWVGRHDSWGNALRYQSLISIEDQSSHGVRKKPVYDIFFVSVAH